ncbi:MAG: hypothetical protein EXS63_08845, partial [Candidatus Omnitrophica bacterium]|nr:hypothetical protein [Candidatus Omnitrophota bacterium]
MYFQSRKAVSVFLVLTLVLGNGFIPSSVAAPILSPQAAAEDFPRDLNQLVVPSQTGKLESAFQGKNGKLVILIQDAHAIPDAQLHIQKLISHFQKMYGVNLITVEGSSSELDPQIFRSFPDKKRLKEVFKSYHDKGELTGVAAAAVFSEASNKKGTEVDSVPFLFEGIEDQSLYEQGIYFYLLAMQEEERLSEELRVKSEELRKEKQTAYSKALLAIDDV